MSYSLLTVPWLRAVCQRAKFEIRALNEYSNKYYYNAVLYLIEVSSDEIVCSIISKTEKQDSINGLLIRLLMRTTWSWSQMLLLL